MGSADTETSGAGTSEDGIYLEKQLQSASEELARVKQQKRDERLEQFERSKRGSGSKSKSQTSSLRDKYMDKINKLKEKKTQEGSRTGLEEVVGTATSLGLSTWIVNEGANEVLVSCAGKLEQIAARMMRNALIFNQVVLLIELFGPARVVQGGDSTKRSTAECTYKYWPFQHNPKNVMLTVGFDYDFECAQDEYKFFLKEVIISCKQPFEVLRTTGFAKTHRHLTVFFFIWIHDRWGISLTCICLRKSRNSFQIQSRSLTFAQSLAWNHRTF